VLCFNIIVTVNLCWDKPAFGNDRALLHRCRQRSS
jgi:hypothetical protein